MNIPDNALYFVTDSSSFSENEFLYRVEEALRGGVDIVQLREKEKSTREYIDLANKLHEITKQYGVPLIIDDRVDVALASGAEGVHLGRDDMDVAIARKILGNNKIIGSTAKTVSTAQEAFQKGADYLGVGAIFPTTTKVKTIITSVTTLGDICSLVKIPVFAIGGLNKDNISVLKGIDISGICAVSAIMKADMVQNAAVELKDAFKKQNEY